MARPTSSSERGEAGVARIKELTKNVGADSVLECVGTKESMMQALQCARPGAMIGYVGVPHGVEFDGAQLFFSQRGLMGGPAPVRRFLPHLMDLVAERKINPGKVFDLTLAARRCRGGLPRDGRAPRHQDHAARVIGGQAMPHVIVKLWPGKSEQQKQKLAEGVTKVVMSSLGYGEESVSVSLEEVKASDWTEKVYKADIINGPGKLYKQPGYEPS